MALMLATIAFVILFFDCGNRSFARKAELLQCKSIPEMKYGEIYYTDTDFVVGSKAQAVCIPGYQVSGESFTKCGEDGEWNPPLGICKRSKREYCRPYALHNIPTLKYDIETEEPQIPLNTTVTLVCPPGQHVEGNPTSTCVRGRWQKGVGYCVDDIVEEVEDQTDLVNGH